MPIFSEKNEYQGLNAHLISYLLDESGGWHSFHAEHIVITGHVINEALPPGYYTRPEKSLQISDTEAGNIDTIPDIIIQRTLRPPSSSNYPSIRQDAATPTLEIPLEATFITIDDSPLSAITIYRIEGASGIGRPVTRVELLSPSNKPPYSGYHQYMTKRQKTLESGLNLVEIDYLHEGRPILPHIPSYRHRQAGSYAYSIMVNNPHPGLAQGVTRIFGFSIDFPIPLVEVPLANDQHFTLDMGKAFDRTFNTSRFYPMVVDYEQIPINFESYGEDDQARIRARMQAVVEKHAG